MRVTAFLFLCFRRLCEARAVIMDAYCNCNSREAEENQSCEDVGDDFESLEPDHVVPSESLECAPEAVGEVEPDGSEPDKVQNRDPPSSEGGVKKIVRIGLLKPGEVLELHVCPEMGEVERDESEDDDSEDNHVP